MIMSHRLCVQASGIFCATELLWLTNHLLWNSIPQCSSHIAGQTLISRLRVCIAAHAASPTPSVTKCVCVPVPLSLCAFAFVSPSCLLFCFFVSASECVLTCVYPVHQCDLCNTCVCVSELASFCVFMCLCVKAFLCLRALCL